jgi:hypothetical protein
MLPRSNESLTMSAFHSNGLSDLLRNPEFLKEQAEKKNQRMEQLLREQNETFGKADYWRRQSILLSIERQVEREFSKTHCLF